MKRRNYLATVGASVALPFGVGGVLSTQDNRLTPEQFERRLPDEIAGYDGEIPHRGETNDSGQIVLAIYEESRWPVGIQFIEGNDPQLIVMMHCTHYYAGSSLSDAVNRLSSFFNQVDVQYDTLQNSKLEYITYKFDDYRIRTEYDHRDNDKVNFRAWVNGDLHTFEERIEFNEFVNQQVQSRLE